MRHQSWLPLLLFGSIDVVSKRVCGWIANYPHWLPPANDFSPAFESLKGGAGNFSCWNQLAKKFRGRRLWGDGNRQGSSVIDQRLLQTSP